MCHYHCQKLVVWLSNFDQSQEAHDGEVYAVRWNTSGSRFATGSFDKKVKIWEVSSGKSSPTPLLFPHPLLSVPGNLCSGSTFSRYVGRCVCTSTLVGCNAGIKSVEFDSADEHLLAATSNDFGVRLWTIAGGRLRVNNRHSSPL